MLKISMEFEDGNVYSAQANPKTFLGLAARSKFKKQFGVPATVMQFMRDAFIPDESEDDEETFRLNPQLTHEQLQHIDDEYMAFFVWLELKRRDTGVPDGTWDQVVEKVVDIEINFEEDPTKATSTDR